MADAPPPAYSRSSDSSPPVPTSSSHTWPWARPSPAPGLVSPSDIDLFLPPPPSYISSISASTSISGSSSSSRSTPTSPTSHAPPAKFRVGHTALAEPLVSVFELKGHLALLHAFAELKRRVEDQAEGEMPRLDGERGRWTWFVALAVERFDVWCQALNPSDSTKPLHIVLPPIDVLMVWHSYMLNPRWYAEDCMRIPACKHLKRFESRFRQLLQDPGFLLVDRPSKPRVEFWKSLTALGFDPIEETRVMTDKSVRCPRCRAAVRVEFMNDKGTGYFQNMFLVACTRASCTIGKIDKGLLALRKIAQDLAARAFSNYVEQSSHLAGTLFTSSTADTDIGNKLKRLFCDKAKSFWVHDSEGPVYGTPEYQEELALAIMKYCSYSLSTLKEQMDTDSQQPSLVNRIMSAYNDDKIYSVELVGAVLRQGSFVEKMCDLGWTSPGYFDSTHNELALDHALARYRAFLHLLSSSPASLFVPTLDIDLVWHTHQLMPEKYDADCKTLLERFVDHDNRLERRSLSSAFDNTCRAWKDRFRIRYTHCGCPTPGDASRISQRLARIVGAYSAQPPIRPPPPSLVPPDRPDVLAATHPSLHDGTQRVVCAGRSARANKSAQQERKEAEDVKANTKANLEVKVNSRRDDKKRASWSGGSIKAGTSAFGNGGLSHSGGYHFDGNNGRDTFATISPPARHSAVHDTPLLTPAPMHSGVGAGGSVSNHGYAVNIGEGSTSNFFSGSRGGGGGGGGGGSGSGGNAGMAP